MDNSYSKMISRLTEYREFLSLTQSQVSELLDTSQSNYSKIEMEKVYLSGPALCSLYEAGWDIDYIMTGKRPVVLARTIQQELEVNEEENKPLFTLFCWAVRNRIKNCSVALGVKNELELLQILNELPKEESVMFCARKMLDVSQEEMAERLMICIKNYREIERGIRHPDAHLMLDIMEITKYRPSLFFQQKGIQWNIMNYIIGSMDEVTRNEIVEFIKIGMSLIKK